jgi:hypothetical protein
VIIDVIFWCMDVFSCDRMRVMYYGDINSLMLYYILIVIAGAASLSFYELVS